MTYKKALKALKTHTERSPKTEYKTSERERERKKRFRDSNPERARGYSKKHYEANKQAYIARAAARRKEYADKWKEFKSKLSCSKCGQNHPATLDFHHVVRLPDNKKVHRLVANGSFKKAIKEITERCVVLCANCHRIHHFEEVGMKKGAEAPSTNLKG